MYRTPVVIFSALTRLLLCRALERSGAERAVLQLRVKSLFLWFPLNAIYGHTHKCQFYDCKSETNSTAISHAGETTRRHSLGYTLRLYSPSVVRISRCQRTALCTGDQLQIRNVYSGLAMNSRRTSIVLWRTSCSRTFCSLEEEQISVKWLNLRSTSPSFSFRLLHFSSCILFPGVPNSYPKSSHVCSAVVTQVHNITGQDN